MTTGFRRDAAGYYIQKDPDSVLDYAVDWSDWLAGDTITTADFTVPAGLTRQSQNASATVATVWLAGGTAGATYSVNCRIVTAAGRTADRSFRVVMVTQ